MNGQIMTYNLFFATLFSVVLSGRVAISKTEEIIKPNIIYILADDLGYGDINILNAESKILTPNLDRIANNGIYFTDAHSNSSVCTPTRYGILTGRYAFRTRLKEGVIWGYSPPLIEEGRTTVASFLEENGYNTACIGKWHLGLEWSKKDHSKEIKDLPGSFKYPENFEDNVNYSQHVKNGPADHGFDYSFIIPASLDMSPYCYIRNNKVVESPIEYTNGKNPDLEGRGVFWRQGKISPGFDFYDVTPTFIDTAVHYINNMAGDKNPFFLYLALPSPHTPWLPTKKYLGISKAGRYGDFVAMIDDLVGKIIKTVYDQKIEKKTLIIFTSDNGSDWRPSDIEEYEHKSNYIFKGRKADIYEGGHRIPFLAQWEGVIPAGTQSDEVMCTTDLLATVAGILNKQLLENSGEDSYNLWPAFIGGVENSPIRDIIIHHSARGFFAVRQGKWKFTPHLGSGGNSIPRLLIPGKNEAPGTLYNLDVDIREENNLYHQYPQKVKELSRLLEKYINQ